MPTEYSLWRFEAWNQQSLQVTKTILRKTPQLPEDNEGGFAGWAPSLISLISGRIDIFEIPDAIPVASKRPDTTINLVPYAFRLDKLWS